MGFLNPLWLLLGAAVGVPVILHLLQRHQGPRVIFPAVRYLRRAEREHARRIRLRQLLLLMLRSAVVLLLALAAARPFLRGAGSGHAPTAVVLILDNSLSSGLVTGDRRVLDELKDRALETLARAGPDDRFWLLRAGAPWEPALPGDAPAIAARVRETTPTIAAADLPAAVARARSILAQAADGRSREIQLLSDLQVGNLRGAARSADTTAARLVLWAPERAAHPNAAVTDITVGGGLAPRAGERSTVVASIGGSLRDSVNVRLSLDGRIAGAAITAPGAAAVIPLPARAPGVVTGEVEIDADALRADDRRVFLATVTPPPTVQLTQPAPFVGAALDVLAGARRISLAPGARDVVIAPGAVGGERAGAAGSVVVLPPATPLELPAVNRRLANLGINWRYAQAQATGEQQFAVAGTGDPLLRALAAVRVMQHYALVPAGNVTQDSVMLRLASGAAWAVRGARARGGRFIVLASPLHDEATTLPASAAMIPLVDRLTGAWSSVDAPRAEIEPGEPIALPRAADAVIDPAGNRSAVVGGGAYEAATAAGVYRVAAGSRIIGAFVVNPARGESDLTYAGAGRAARVFRDYDVERAADPSDWLDAIYGSRVGREIWRAALFLLLAVLVIEAFAAASGQSARARPAEAAEA